MFGFKIKKKEEPKEVQKDPTLGDNGFPKKDNPLEKAGVATTDKDLFDKLSELNKSTSSPIYDKANELANSPANSIKPEKKSPKAPLARVTVKRAQEEGNLVIRIKTDSDPQFVLIHDYEFRFRKDSSDPDKPYLIIGNGGSLTVNEEELNYIFVRFKNIK